MVAGILGYLGRDALPEFTFAGLVYFALLMALTWIINGAVFGVFRNKKYKIKSQDIEAHIQ